MDYFKTYAPVVSWSNVCLALTLILSNGLRTKQVDYTNYFSQSYLKEKKFIRRTEGIIFKAGKYKVLKLIQIVYGIKQAPRKFFGQLQDVLLRLESVQSDIYKCLFIKSDMIYLLYVDNTIIARPNDKSI